MTDVETTATAPPGIPDLYQNPSLRAYLSNVRDWHGYVRFLGLPDRRDNPDIIIDRLFVEPLLTNRYISPDEEPENWLEEAETVLDTLAEHRRLIVLGDPGSGKSTLLNYLAWQFARPETDEWTSRLGWRLPVPIVLRELDIRGVTEFDGLLEAFLKHEMSTPLLNSDILQSALKSGQALVLVDGIDEIGTPADRENLRAALYEGFVKFPGSSWLLSSRIVGYEEVPFSLMNRTKRKLPGGGTVEFGSDILQTFLETQSTFSPLGSSFAKLAKVVANKLTEGGGRDIVATRYIAPFDDQRITAFARNWYVQRESAATRAGEDAKHLVKAVHADKAILRLARIPNLLTMMALIHRIEATLPHGRAILYDRISEAYLESIDRFRGVYSGAHDLPQKKQWLARIGFEMQRGRIKKDDHDGTEILANLEEITEWLAPEMARGGTSEGLQTPEQFLDYVGRRSGLFLPRGEGRYAFVHLSFQEYFAAVALEREVTGLSWAKRKESALGFDEEALRAWAGQSVWRETFVFLFEMLAAKGDWHDDLLESLFGERFSRLETPTSDESIVNTALLLARLLLNPRAGLTSIKKSESIRACVTIGLREISNQEIPPWEGGSIFQALFSDDPTANNRILTETVTQLANLQEKYLNLNHTRVDNIAPLADLTSLQELFLGGTQVSDISPLAKLANLNRLIVYGTRVADISPLTNLRELNFLHISGTQITDLSPLTNLRELNSLHLSGTQITDLSPLVKLTELNYLNLSGTQITDISPLANLTGLSYLELNGTQITDLSPLAKLTNLSFLELNGTQITDISPLANLTGLSYLELNGTQITDISPLANLTNLRFLELTGTQITDISPLAKLTNLSFLELNGTQITDIAPLVKLTNLRYLNLSETEITDISPLAKLSDLEQVDLMVAPRMEADIDKLKSALPECRIAVVYREKQNAETHYHDENEN